MKELAENEKIPQIKESLLKLREALINVLEEVKDKNELLQDLVFTTNGIIENIRNDYWEVRKLDIRRINRKIK